VFSLETRQVQLQLALEERSKEIEIHKDMLRLQIKNAEEERSSAHAELRERVSKVEKMKRRYEILMTQFTCPMDDSPSALPPPAMGGKGEGGLFWPSAGGGSKLDEEEHFVEHTQAYYVIRAAQQREELQREGDELDAKIRKAEKEIKALENTLRHMNDRNEEFRML
ncbi:Coiled-coil domain-containing protein 39, partial [Quaeritorhiza haematococci]